jgi:hypothetical protein
MELWNEICFLINEHLKRNSSERDFQIETENLFEKLGWSRFRGEVISQETIHIGAANIRLFKKDFWHRPCVA